MSLETDVPRGETPTQVSERADRLIARLRILEGNIAIFSHGHFGRVLAARLDRITGRASTAFSSQYSVTQHSRYEHNLAEDPAIVLWNAVSST